MCYKCRSSDCLFLDGLIAVVYPGFVLQLFLDGGRCSLPWLCATAVLGWWSLWFTLALCYSCSWMVVAVVFHGFVLKLFLDGGRCRFSWLCVTGENRVVVWSVLVVAVGFPGFVLQLFLDGGRCRFFWLCV